MSRFDGNGHNGFHGMIGRDGDYQQPPSFLADRLPPQNLDAERGVLGACLMDREALETALETLDVDDFYRDAHQIVFRAVKGLASQQIVVDAVTVADELIRLGVFESIGGDDLLEEIANSVPHHGNVAYHAAIVREKSIARRIAQSQTEVIRDVYSNCYTASELVERLAKGLGRIEAVSNDRENHDESLFRAWPRAPDPAIWHGIAGGFTKAIEPHSESDPVAILGQLLVAMGNVIGRKAHWMNEATRHGLNLFLCVVGNTAQARKGSSWNHVRWLLKSLDPVWTETRIKGGLTTGEGLIDQVRDRQTKRTKVGDYYEDREIDPGVDDKRVLFMEGEFGSVLTNMGRDNNNLAMVIRHAWDSGFLSTLSKNNPSRATNAHVSIIGHITETELKSLLTANDSKNGFGNRFLWLCARRSKLLPHGGRIHTVNFQPFIAYFREVLRFIDVAMDETTPIIRDGHANQLWESMYAELSAATPGLIGSLTDRATPYVMRLASLYAILDQSLYVREEHLKAGLAFWSYCRASVEWIWAAEADDEAVRLIAAVKAAGADGLTRTQMNRRCFHGKKSSEDFDKILLRLVRGGHVEPHPSTAANGARMRAARWVIKDTLSLDPARLARFAGSNDASSDAPVF